MNDGAHRVREVCRDADAKTDSMQIPIESLQVQGYSPASSLIQYPPAYCTRSWGENPDRKRERRWSTQAPSSLARRRRRRPPKSLGAPASSVDGVAHEPGPLPSRRPQNVRRTRSRRRRPSRRSRDQVLADGWATPIRARSHSSQRARSTCVRSSPTASGWRKRRRVGGCGRKRARLQPRSSST